MRQPWGNVQLWDGGTRARALLLLLCVCLGLAATGHALGEGTDAIPRLAGVDAAPETALVTVRYLDWAGDLLWADAHPSGAPWHAPAYTGQTPEGQAFAHWYDAAGPQAIAFSPGTALTADITLAPRFTQPHSAPASPSADGAAPLALGILGGEAHAAPVYGQFVATVAEYGILGLSELLFYDRVLTQPFALAVDAGGAVYIDVAGGAVPRETVLDTDCIAPPYGLQLLCDTHDLSQWGWRTAFETGMLGAGGLAAHMGLGEIDAATGTLLGYQPGADGDTVYLVHRTAVSRYRVYYYGRDGEPLSGGMEYALPGSDLTRAPIGIIFPLAQGDALALVERGTQWDAPSRAVGPAHLQQRAARRYTVSFHVDGLTHGMPQLVDEGGQIRWDEVPPVEDGKGRIFTGWQAQGDAAPLDAHAPVYGDLRLHARFEPLHHVTYRDALGTVLAVQAVRHGQAADVDAVTPPARNQLFTGWMDAGGLPLTAQRPVLADMEVTASFAPLDAQAWAQASCVWEDGDGTARALPETTIEAYAALPLRYDADADAYYIEKAALPHLAWTDAFYNRLYFHADPALWRWGYAAQDAHGSLSEHGGRWYLSDGFDCRQATGNQVALVYTPQIRLLRVTLLDDAGSAHPQAYYVLHGESAASLDTDPNALALLAQGKRAAFLGWQPVQEGRGDFPHAVDAPITLAARYRPQHLVSFFLSDQDVRAWHTLLVLDGALIDWDTVPAPQADRMRFDGWQHYDLGLGPSPTQAQVHAPLSYVACFVRQACVRFYDMQGGLLHEAWVDIGADASGTQVAAPAREGLRFTHWEDAHGVMLTGENAAWADMALTPVYTATVTFLSGDEVLAERTVREGSILWDVPDAPVREGYAFAGWDVPLEETPIPRDMTVHAVFEREAEPEAAQEDTPAESDEYYESGAESDGAENATEMAHPPAMTLTGQATPAQQDSNPWLAAMYANPHAASVGDCFD